MAAPARRRFATTRWSLVLAAGRARNPDSEDALAALCEAYWHPVYSFVRRRGYPREDAEDLTQGFFARVLEKNYLGNVRSQRGRFRSFLLTALKYFLANEWERRRAAKRGGATTHLSLDFAQGEEVWSREPSRELTPEQVFERRWTLILLDRVLARIRRDYELSGKSRLFESVKEFLIGGDGRPYREVAAELGMSEGAVRLAVLRLRRRYGQLLRDEIAQTVHRPEETEEELRHLLRTLGSGDA